MQPYIIQQGDYVALLAYKFGFDADTVWNDPSNADLQKLRQNPNILFSGDTLNIPDQTNSQPATHTPITGQMNTFVSSAPTVAVTIQLVDNGQSTASLAYTIPELPDLPPGQTTGADGTVTVEVPVTLASFTIALTAADGTVQNISCSVGALDPINTQSGIVQRLQHLGYLPPDATPAGLGLDGIRGALVAFKADQPPGSAPASAAPPSSSTGVGSVPPPPDSSQNPGGDSSSPPSSAQAAWTPDTLWSPDDIPPPSDSNPASQPSSGPPPSSPPESSPPPTSSPPPGTPSAPPPSSSSPVSAPPDNSGLSDQGILDDETSQLLSTAHGGV